MAVINFPDSPSDGDTQDVGGITYTYSSSKGYWTAAASAGGGGGGASVTTDDSAPSSPSDGDLWYDTDDGGMFVYYEDTDSSQWVEVIGSQGATGAAGADGGAGVASVYATVNDLPVSGNTQGDMAHVTANNTLYFWNGSGWYKIALINTNPSITGVASSYDLADDGTATTVTITASDPEGLPITYSIASDTSGNIATVSQGTGANTNVFTITPSTNTAYAGSFTLTFRASDGVNIATAPATFTLQFSVENSNYTTALITTNGSTGINTTFTDSSSNSHTITANGNVNQSSFSPYRHGGYSLFCNGSGGDYIKTDTSADFAFGSNDFTVECWYYPVSKAQNYPRILHFGEYWSNSNAWGLLDRHNSVNTKFTVQSFALGTILESTTTVSNNQWYHLAVVRSGTTITLYVDGVAEDTYDISTNNYPDASSTSYLSLLNVSNGSNLNEAQANGYLRDVRVVQGTAVYTSAFTPTTESLTAISNTKFLLGSIPYIFDSSTSAHTFTQTTGGDYSTQPFGPYDYKEYAVGDHGGSAYFDGSGDYTQTTLSVSSASDYTLEFWTYFRSWDDNKAVLSFNRQWGFGAYGSQLAFWKYGSPNIYYQFLSSPKTNQWYHIALVSDISATETKIYVNGELSYTISDNVDLASTLELGRFEYTSSSTKQLDGYLSDVRIVESAVYTTDFTPPTSPLTSDTNTSILLNMQDAVILDKSQSTKHLRLAGNTTASTTQYKYLSSSIYFDGNGDLLEAPHDTTLDLGSGDFTVEFWLNASSWSSGTGGLVGKKQNDNTSGWQIYRDSNNATKLNGRLGSQNNFLTTSSVTTGTWEHWALVRTGSTLYWFKNGTLDSTGSNSVNISDSGANLKVGYADTWSAYANFYLSDLRITKGLARYTANFTPPTAALQG